MDSTQEVGIYFDFQVRKVKEEEEEEENNRGFLKLPISIIKRGRICDVTLSYLVETKDALDPASSVSLPVVALRLFRYLGKTNEDLVVGFYFDKNRHLAVLTDEQGRERTGKICCYLGAELWSRVKVKCKVNHILTDT